MRVGVRVAKRPRPEAQLREGLTSLTSTSTTEMADLGVGQVQVEEVDEVAPPAPGEQPDSLAVAKPEDADADFDDDIDETLAERLLGLTEMLPAPVRDASSRVFSGSVSGVKAAYGMLCASSWVFFSSAAILFVPLIFEVERTQMEEMHKQQQRQILLGPNAAVSGSMMPPQAASGM